MNLFGVEAKIETMILKCLFIFYVALFVSFRKKIVLKRISLNNGL